MFGISLHCYGGLIRLIQPPGCRKLLTDHKIFFFFKYENSKMVELFGEGEGEGKTAIRVAIPNGSLYYRRYLTLLSFLCYVTVTLQFIYILCRSIQHAIQVLFQLQGQ